MEHSAGCVVYDVHPLMRIIGTVMIFVGILLFFFSIQLNQLFLDAIIQTAVFVLLVSVFRQMHYFAFFDPTEPYEFTHIPLALIAFVVSILGAIISGRLFRGAIEYGPALVGLVNGYYLIQYVIVTLNGLFHLFDKKEGVPDPVSPTATLLLSIVGGLVGAYIGYFDSQTFSLALQAFVSACLIVRGSTYWYNAGFPNELTLLNAATNEMNGIFSIPKVFYAYLILILIITYFGFARSMRKLEEK